MADNVAITAGSGTTIATDDAGAGGHVQVVKLAISTDGSATAIPADAANGLDVDVTRLPAEVGALTETAPASDTASSGLNGRLQRIAQRITSLIALVPAALGQGTMAQSFRVVVASDQSALPVASHAVTNAGTFAVQGTANATEVHLGEVGGRTVKVRTEVTRPSNATAYTANDAIGNTGTAATWAFVLARVATGSGIIQGVMVSTDQTTCIARLEIDYYDADTAVIIADNAEATRLYADQAKYLGSILLPAMAKKTTASNLAEAQNITDRLGFKCAGSSTIFAVVRTLDAFTPASAQKISITHVVSQD